MRGDQAGDERADRGRRQRRAAAALARHLVALERGDDRGALARRVEQDRGGRAAIHAAVVDAGEHDQRAGRVELVGDRQEQRDGQRRPDAGQHADRGAERHADQRVEQVHRLERGDQAVGEEREGVHVQRPSARMQPLERPGGQRELQAPAKIIQMTKASTMPTGWSATAGRGRSRAPWRRTAGRWRSRSPAIFSSSICAASPPTIHSIGAMFCSRARESRRAARQPRSPPPARTRRRRSRRETWSARRGRRCAAPGIVAVLQKMTIASDAAAGPR